MPKTPWTPEEHRVVDAVRALNARLHPDLPLTEKWAKGTYAAARALLRDGPRPVLTVLRMLGRFEMLARRDVWYFQRSMDLRLVHSRWEQIHVQAPPENVVDFPLGERAKEALAAVAQMASGDEMGALLHSLKHVAPGSGMPK